MSYDNNLTGALFKNDKGDNPKRPDSKGMLTIDGVEYWLSGWTRTCEKGKHQGEKFISLKAERKDQQAAKPSNPPEKLDENGDSVLPF